MVPLPSPPSPVTIIKHMPSKPKESTFPLRREDRGEDELAGELNRTSGAASQSHGSETSQDTWACRRSSQQCRGVINPILQMRTLRRRETVIFLGVSGKPGFGNGSSDFTFHTSLPMLCSIPPSLSYVLQSFLMPAPLEASCSCLRSPIALCLCLC